MRRVDFSTVINIIIENCRENMHTKKNRERAYSQFDLVCDMFYDFYTECDEACFDNTSVSRWIKGNRPVPAAIVNYYRENGAETIGDYFQENCLKIVFDKVKLFNELVMLVQNDYTLSEEKKADILTENIAEFSNDYKICSFIGRVIFAAIDRPFIPADKAILPTSAITVSECIFGAEVPAPCRYFCGRDTELDELHTALQEHSKVFIKGFAGIGKSEFAKAYAKEFKKEYRNILYFNYHGSLKENITDMDFAGDNLSDNEHIRFTKHIRFLKSMRSDSLIIIDNFNTANDSFLSTLINYGCKMIFTTRSNIDCGYTFNLDVISNADELYQLVSKYFSYAGENKSVINELIETVHHHTLSVEMIAKLLEKGLHTPEEILEHLKQNSADPDSTDKIKISKDGINAKETYYNHIRSLFSLYLLDEGYQNIMRNMIFFDKVRIRYFAKMLELNNANGINELCELGLIENNQADLISLHPMIKDIVLLDLKPTFDNCDVLITNLKTKLQIIGIELYDSKTIISAIRNVMKYIGSTDSNSYLNFLEAAYIFLDNYHEYDLMERIISETENLLSNKAFGTVNDRALLLNNKAMLPVNRNDKLVHSIGMMNKALSMCDNKANPVLFANINMNLGLLYIENNEAERGLEFMDKAYLFIKLTRAYNNDFITIARNYAATLSENSRVTKAIEVLKECEFATEECCSNNHAALLYDLGAAYILSGNYPLAVKKYSLAFAEYFALGCSEELTARKIAAARQMQRHGYEYPKEWEFDYLE
ncbi:putative uncharacterized protein [Ruminococcus sp. CAG:353]|nr:putative uncharacterized protein [Ruminococcus sp. CAG:353]